MEWTKVTPAPGNDLLAAIQGCDFEGITESSFHGDKSLLEDMDIHQFDISELSSADLIQVGGGKDDFDIWLVHEKALKNMGVRQVTYELTFKDRLFRQHKKMKEVLDLLREAFQRMLDHIKRELSPGDIIRVAIHNDRLHLPVFVPFHLMENMNVM